MQEVQTN